MIGSKSDSLENGFLRHLFNNDPMTDIGSAAGLVGSSVAGYFYLRLYNTSEMNDQLTGTEVSYDGYVAGGIPIPRTTDGFLVVENNVYNAAQLSFGLCLSGSETVRYFALFKDNNTSSESHRLYWGQLEEDYIVTKDAIPTVPAEYLNINEN